VEALFKEEAGGDNLSVAWKLPSGAMENPIPASRIGYYANITTSATAISNENSEELSIYPVPASEKIRIKCPTISGKASLSVSDLNGKQMIVRSVNGSGTIDQEVSALPAGIYFVNISAGNDVYRGKFVVVR